MATRKSTQQNGPSVASIESMKTAKSHTQRMEAAAENKDNQDGHVLSEKEHSIAAYRGSNIKFAATTEMKLEYEYEEQATRHATSDNDDTTVEQEKQLIDQRSLNQTMVPSPTVPDGRKTQDDTGNGEEVSPPECVEFLLEYAKRGETGDLDINLPSSIVYDHHILQHSSIVELGAANRKDFCLAPALKRRPMLLPLTEPGVVRVQGIDQERRGTVQVLSEPPASADNSELLVHAIVVVDTGGETTTADEEESKVLATASPDTCWRRYRWLLVGGTVASILLIKYCIYLLTKKR